MGCFAIDNLLLYAVVIFPFLFSSALHDALHATLHAALHPALHAALHLRLDALARLPYTRYHNVHHMFIFLSGGTLPSYAQRYCAFYPYTPLCTICI